MTGLVAGVRAEQETGWNPEVHDHDDRDVELVLAFLNTVDVEAGTDVLADENRWQEWAHTQGLSGMGDRDQARLVRDALRAAIIDQESPPDGEQPGAALRVVVHGEGPVLVAGDPVGAVLAASVRLTVLGQWDRVKICPADTCRWAFFDHSRNRSRTWCSMRVCGNRTKARNWRERARSRPDE